MLVGSAVNTPIGAFSADLTAAVARLDDEVYPSGTMSGQSARLTYSKLLPSTGTNFALAAYRYSTSAYLNLADTARLRADLRAGEGPDRIGRQRSRLDANLSQSLGDGNGSVWMTGNTTTFWNRGGNTTTFNAGYSNTFRNTTYSVSAQRLRETFSAGSAAGGSSSTAMRMEGMAMFMGVKDPGKDEDLQRPPPRSPPNAPPLRCRHSSAQLAR